MPKSYKLNLCLFIILMVNVSAFAQENTEYKDVVLDGKAAKLNVTTGEITLVEKKAVANEVDVKTNKIDSSSNEVIIPKPDTLKIPEPTTVIDTSVMKDVHIVKKGETLYGLSKRYNVSINDLKIKNNLSSNIIKIGQSLNISKDVESVSVWIVSKGDTLYSIAKRNGTTVEAITQLNGLTSSLIHVGQKLQLK